MIKDERGPTKGQELYPYTYALDTDEVRTAVPESHTANDEEGSKPSKEREYESPMTFMKPRLPSRNNAQRTRKESVQSCNPRCKENVIYNSGCYDETGLDGRRYTGYSLPNTDLVSPTSDAFSYDNPLRFFDDEDIYAKPSLEYDGQRIETRARENNLYESTEKTEEWKTYTASTALGVKNGKSGRKSGIEKREKRKVRSRRWTTIAICFIFILTCAALILASWAFWKSNQALSYFKLSRNKGSVNNTKILSKLSESFNELKGKSSLQFRNFSKLSESFNELKRKNSPSFRNFSKLSENVHELKMKINHEHLRLNKMNVSFWQKVKSGSLKGPRGHNGTRGKVGPQGKQGRPGMSIKNYTCQYNETTEQTDDVKKSMFTKNAPTDVIFDVSCESNIDPTPTRYPASYKFKCICTKPETNKRKLTCTIKYVLCSVHVNQHDKLNTTKLPKPSS